MRLLSKQDIQQQKAVTRKLEIDEGKKLAKTVDSLRELKVIEEQNLEAFRAKTLTNIQAEITAESEKRDSLKKEVLLLEKRKLKALIPLDAEWKLVNEENAILAEATIKLKEKEKELDSRASAISEKERETQLLLDKAITDKEDVAQTLQKAKTERLAAKKRLMEATGIREEAYTYMAYNQKLLLKREEEIAIKERTLELRESSLTKQEQKLSKSWELLEDRQAQFERNIKKLSK